MPCVVYFPHSHLFYSRVQDGLNYLTSSSCRVYFAVNLLNVVFELLDDSKQDTVLVIGCDTLTTFIYGQVIYIS